MTRAHWLLVGAAAAGLVLLLVYAHSKCPACRARWAQWRANPNLLRSVFAADQATARPVRALGEAA